MADTPAPATPYVGPRPFDRTEEDRARFFGRDEETQEIVSLVMGHPAVLVYAQSGAGKTSLFNARIAPELEKRGFEVLPLTRVKRIVPPEVKADGVANLYMYCALLAWATEADPAALANTSLTDYLAGRPRPTTSTGRPQPRVIIFDQLEELFGFYPKDWRKQQDDFFEQVAAALAADPLLRAVFVIREDYLAQLDPFAPLLPEELRVRFRVERLREPDALLAVTGPLEGTGCSYAPDVADELIHELLQTRVLGPDGKPMEVEGQYVEPVQLQVVCQSLWNSLPPGTTEISSEQLQRFGDVDQALARFYEKSLQKAVEASGVSEAQLRDWFTTALITPASTRGTVFRGPEDTAGIPNAAVDVLDAEHIIRREERAGGSWYELTHDRFIEPIQKANTEWQAAMEQTDADLRAVQARRSWRRLVVGAAVLGAIALVASLIAVSSRQNASTVALVATAEAANAAAVASAATAEAASAAAVASQATAEAAKANALASLALSDRLANEAQAQIAAAPRLALLLGVEALRSSDTPTARWALLKALIGQPEPVAGDLPGWETDSVTTVDFSPDGQKILSASRDGRARVWDAAGGQAQIVLAGHEGPIWSASFSPDGARIVTAGDDGTTKVWDAASGQELLTLIGHGDPVLSASFSPDGAHIVTASTDKTAKVWDAASGRELLTLTGHESWVNSAAYDPTGDWIVTASADGTAQVWNAVTGAESLTLAGHADAVNSAAYNPTGDRIVTASADGTARVWDAVTGEALRALGGHEGSIVSASYNPAGDRIAIAGNDGTARVWNAGTGKEIFSLRHNGPVNAAAFSPDGRLLATVSDDGSLRVWNAEDGSAAMGWELFPVAIELACRTAGRDLTQAEWNQFIGPGQPEKCTDVESSWPVGPPPPPPAGGGGNY